MGEVPLYCFLMGEVPLYPRAVVGGRGAARQQGGGQDGTGIPRL